LPTTPWVRILPSLTRLPLGGLPYSESSSRTRSGHTISTSRTRIWLSPGVS